MTKSFVRKSPKDKKKQIKEITDKLEVGKAKSALQGTKGNIEKGSNKSLTAGFILLFTE